MVQASLERVRLPRVVQASLSGPGCPEVLLVLHVVTSVTRWCMSRTGVPEVVPGQGSVPRVYHLPTLLYYRSLATPGYTIPHPSPLVVHASTDVTGKKSPVKDLPESMRVAGPGCPSCPIPSRRKEGSGPGSLDEKERESGKTG